MIRMATDRIGGTTYSFSNLTAFLNNQATTVQYLGNVSAASPFNNGATGQRHVKQQYSIFYAQDEWHLTPTATVNFGLRYEYYTPLTEENNLQVKFNIDTGQIDPNTTSPYHTKKNNFLPRVSFAYAPGKTVFKTGRPRTRSSRSRAIGSARR
jgi:outer membrane receptor protein involved in Fe transport